MSDARQASIGDRIPFLGKDLAEIRNSSENNASRTQKLPDRMTLLCGVVESTHNYVAHRK